MTKAIEAARRIVKNLRDPEREYDGISRDCDAAANEIERLCALLERDAPMREALERLADAADYVGVYYFDTDAMSPEVEEMQAATQAARAALSQKDTP